MKGKKEKVGAYTIEPNELPAIRIAVATGNKANNNLCFVVGGGIGDRVCAEPTLRFALENFKDVTISLMCQSPELFRHLTFKEVFDMERTHPIMGRHLLLHTYPSHSALLNQFVNANMCHCVDYPTLVTLRGQLPMAYKQVKIVPAPVGPDIANLRSENYVLLHTGKSWPSRTFPGDWWKMMIAAVNDLGKTAVLIGKNSVEIPDPGEGTIDLREQMSLNEFIWACQNAWALVTNDSSPVHLAAPGDSRVAFIPTCRRGDLITHYRKGGFGWRMRDFSRNEMWAKYDMIPNKLAEFTINATPGNEPIERFLPHPWEIAEWFKEQT